MADTASGVWHAFVYDGTHGMVDLNSLVLAPGWTLEGATAINDAGQIVGYGINPSGNLEAFLITAPEPSTWIMFVIGAASLLACGFRKRSS
jgi:hypothetical protein